MKIHRIHAKNYRTLLDTTIDFESNYCAISGHNNAGKSCVVRLILHLLNNSESTPWRLNDYAISYDVDKTQWLKDKQDITIEYHLSINKADDSALVAIVEKLSNKTYTEEILQICVRLSINSENAKSTHSPFMLNQSSPRSNILLKRSVQRGKTLETIVVDTSGSEWMKPFADHLGVIPDEFAAWRDVIASTEKCLLLVEGDLDKEYIDFLRHKFPEKFPIPPHVKVLGYGGRGNLKNATIVSFVKQVVPKVFITFDLDAKAEVERHLEQIGLEEKRDFLAIGKNRPGRRAIEGLLPEKVFQAVYGREVELVSALADVGDDRKSARSALKRKLLAEFIASEDYSDSDLKDFETLGKTIAKALS